MNSKEVADIVKEVIPVKDAYCDALQPGARQVGKAGETLGMLLNALLSPVRNFVFNLNVKQEQLERELLAKMKEFPAEDIVEQAPLHVVVPAIQAWSYSIECDELRGLYSNLLANSMLKSQQSNIHPGFVEIIRQMHPVEACIFKVLAERTVYPVVEVLQFENGLKKKLLRKFGYLGGYRTRGKHFTLININGEELIPSQEFVQNLERLGLIEVAYDRNLTNKELYSRIEAHAYFKEIDETLKKKGLATCLARGIIRLTPLGKAFAALCLNLKWSLDS